MSKLAINGGPKLRQKDFPPYPVIGQEEKRAAMEVLESGRLSYFLASPGQYFNGGKKIKELESLFNEYHGTKHAIAFNSATAALHAAVVACGVQPAEEVVASCYTFTSSATCALMANAVPVFADVDPDTFNISPESIRKRISPLTRAIIPVHLFGNPADMGAIMKIAQEHNLKVIEDCAQAPGSRYRGKPVGTIGDCGIFSLTENKNITSGEGGVLITNDDQIADVARLVRNHGEAILAGQPRSYSSSILGYNYRMTEVDAAIGCEQFRKMDAFNQVRIDLSLRLYDGLKGIPGLTPQKAHPEDKHTYYITGFRYDERKIGAPARDFAAAVSAEGVPFGAGYVKPLYTAPLYHANKPFVYSHYKGKASYENGICPNAEMLHAGGLLSTQMCRPPATGADADDIIAAVRKVYENRAEIARPAGHGLQPA